MKVYFPNMALTMVRRTTAKLPKYTYLFRCDPKYTKLEIKEYLTKVYGVNVASVNTSISLGTVALLLSFPDVFVVGFEMLWKRLDAFAASCGLISWRR